MEAGKTVVSLSIGECSILPNNRQTTHGFFLLSLLAKPSNSAFWLFHCVAIQNLLCVKATFEKGDFSKANSAEFGFDAQILGGSAKVGQKARKQPEGGKEVKDMNKDMEIEKLRKQLLEVANEINRISSTLSNLAMSIDLSQKSSDADLEDIPF